MGNLAPLLSTQRSKLLNELPAIDIVITMGCNVQCPFLPCGHREDWVGGYQRNGGRDLPDHHASDREKGDRSEAAVERGLGAESEF